MFRLQNGRNESLRRDILTNDASWPNPRATSGPDLARNCSGARSLYGQLECTNRIHCPRHGRLWQDYFCPQIDLLHERERKEDLQCQSGPSCLRCCLPLQYRHQRLSQVQESHEIILTGSKWCHPYMPQSFRSSVRPSGKFDPEEARTNRVSVRSILYFIAVLSDSEHISNFDSFTATSSLTLLGRSKLSLRAHQVR